MSNLKIVDPKADNFFQFFEIPVQRLEAISSVVADIYAIKGDRGLDEMTATEIVKVLDEKLESPEEIVIAQAIFYASLMGATLSGSRTLNNKQEGGRNVKYKDS